MYSSLFNKRSGRRIAATLLLSLLMQSLAPLLPLTSGSSIAYADTPCGVTTSSGPAITTQYGGVKLDKAATFLANMDDITGAYFDQGRNQIVFVGKTNTTLPEFDKDDLAVAIRAIIFNNAIPAVSIEFKDLNNISAYPTMNVLYYGGIEDTNFGKVLLDADVQLKRYMMGGESGNPVQTAVLGYRSVLARWIENGPDVVRTTGSASRWWISPLTVTLKRDTTSNAFVFDTVAMQVQSAPLMANNDPAWDKAAQDFATQMTQSYDAYAAEMPSFAKAKQLGKITSVIKWLKDNQIATDFQWAKNYQPTFVPTSREVPVMTSGTMRYTSGNYSWDFWIEGGVEYSTPNNYTSDTTGASLQMKVASSAAAPSSTDGVSWTFTSNGQTYNSVAVSADLFRSVGAYAYSETDASLPTTAQVPFSLTRSYSSFATDINNGFGFGWTFMPATLTDALPGIATSCTVPGGYTGSYPYRLAATTPAGRETFTLSCGVGYIPDDPLLFHTKIVPDTAGYLNVVMKDRTFYAFSRFPVNNNFPLYRIGDANAISKITFSYNANYTRVNSMTEAYSGKYITLTYNALDQVSSVVTPSGTLQYGYDANGDLVSATDARGNTTTYQYNAGHLLKSVTDRAGTRMIDNTYDSSGRVVLQTDARNVPRTITYNNTDRSVLWSDPNGRSERTAYDSKARPLQVINAHDATTTFAYDTTSNAPTSIADARGNVSSFAFDAKGNPLSYTTPDGGRTLFTWDSSNNLLQASDQRYIPITGTPKVATYAYDTKGNRTQANVAGISTTNFTYTTQGKVASITDPRGNITRFTYNSSGLPLTIQDPLGRITTYTYDSAGRVTQITDPLGVVTNMTHDANGNRLSVSTPAGAATYTYDANDRLLSTTDPAGALVRRTYSPSGNLTSVVDPLGASTAYGYDSYGNVVQSVDPLSRVTTFSYDSMNRETLYRTPGGKSWTTSYDAVGNPIAQATPTGTQTAVFDSLSRITSSVAGSASLAYTYDSAGRLTRVTGPAGATNYAYDIKDRLTQTTDTYGNIISYQYDLADNLTRITYPDGKTVQNQFDAAGHLTQQKDWTGGVTLYTYTANGALSTKTLPNGISEAYSYDSAGRIASIVYGNLSQPTLFRQIFSRDARGFVSRIVEDGSTVTAHATNYQFDAAGKLLSAIDTASATSTYAYDTVGNITSNTASRVDFVPTIATTTVTVFKDAATTTTIIATAATSTTVYATTTRTLVRSIAPTVPYLSRYLFNGTLASSAKRADSLAPSQLLTESTRLASGSGRFADANGTYVFDGSKTQLSLALVYAPSAGSTTLSAWVKMAPGTSGTILGATNSSPAGFMRMYVQQGILHGDLNWTSGSNTYALVASSSAIRIDDNAWHKVDVAFANLYPPANGDIFSNAIYLYVDGALVLTKKGNTVNYNLPSFNYGWKVGAMTNPNKRVDKYFKGSIDEVAITNTALTSPSQIQGRFAAEATTSPIYIWTPAATTSTSYATTTLALTPTSTSTTITSIATSTATTTVPASTVTATAQSYATTTTTVAPVITNTQTFLATTTATTTIVTLTSVTAATTTNTFTISTSVSTTTLVATPRSLSTSNAYSADDELLLSVTSGTAPTATVTHTYDAEGNLKSTAGSSSRAYSWTSLGQLSSVASTAFTYDASGNRIGKSAATTTRYVNDVLAPNALVLVEANASNAASRINVWGGHGLISTGGTATTSRYYPITDSQGSVRFLSDSSGSIIRAYQYDPYGVSSTYASSASTSPYQYTGENLDSETGLVYLRARYYDPATGRFISRDPVRGVLDNPLTQNPYIYAGDNPMMYSDPSGEQAFALPGAGIGSFFGPVGTACGFVIGGIASLVIVIWAGNQIATLNLSQSGAGQGTPKPSNPPSGTVPIDQAGFPRGTADQIKKIIGARPNDWTGIAPNGDIITGTPNGEVINHGPIEPF